VRDTLASLDIVTLRAAIRRSASDWDNNRLDRLSEVPAVATPASMAHGGRRGSDRRARSSAAAECARCGQSAGHAIERRRKLEETPCTFREGRFADRVRLHNPARPGGAGEGGGDPGVEDRGDQPAARQSRADRRARTRRIPRRSRKVQGGPRDGQCRCLQMRDRSPFNGITVEQKAQEFQYATPGQPLLEVLDDRSVEIELIAPPRWLGWLLRLCGPDRRDRQDLSGRDHL
jgi:hypothetical protein